MSRVPSAAALHARRTLLKRLSALGLAGATTGGAVGVSFAQARTLAASTFPGAWETAHRSVIVPAMTKATGVKDITLTPLLPLEKIARLTASKANPAFDVIIMDDGGFQLGVQNELFEPLPALANAKDIPKRFQYVKNLGIGVSLQVFGIGYNTERIKTPPTSWNDLLRPEFKGRVGLVQIGSTLGGAWMVDIARMNGGSEENMDPAFAWLKKVLPNVSAVAPSPGALSTLLGQGQVDITILYSNNLADLQGKGLPIALARPDTGWGVVRSGMHIIRNSKNQDLAAEYINQALSVDVQSRLAEMPFALIPTNVRTPMSKPLLQYAKTVAEVEGFNQPDWVRYSPLRQPYIDRFNREVKVGA
jgi:putative spermidine/putrescine transport system substrate-binding protein